MSDITVKFVEDYDEAIYQKLVEQNLEGTGVFIPPWEISTNTGDPDFKTNAQKIRVGAFHEDRLVGLSWGASESKSRFHQHISLVAPEYRRQGIYSKMLLKMLELTSEYDEVDSSHQLFNNAVIQAKLKHDFYIIGIDQSVMIGPRLKMRYFHNKTLLNLMRFRVGVIADPR